MSWKGCVTNTGEAILVPYTYGGHTLTITKATVGSGTRDEADMKSATDLVTPKMTASINRRGYNAITHAVTFGITLGPSSGDAYVAHEVGIWAKLDNGTERLLALHQDSGDGIVIPSAAETPDFSFRLNAIISMSNTSDLEITVDPTAFITQENLEDTLENMVVDIENGGTGATTAADAREALGAASTDEATQSAAGLLSATDKTHLDALVDHDVITEVTNTSTLATFNTTYSSGGSIQLEKIGKLCILNFYIYVSTSNAIPANTTCSLLTLKNSKHFPKRVHYFCVNYQNTSANVLGQISNSGVLSVTSPSQIQKEQVLRGEVVYLASDYGS